MSTTAAFDKVAFGAMLAREAGGDDKYLRAPLAYVEATLNVRVAWMSLEDGKLTAYCYNRESGETLEEAIGGKVAETTDARGESYLLWTKAIEGITV